MYIPFLNQDDLILDNNGKIIPGAKIEVFDPVSNNHIDIYTYDGSNEQYTIAENPVYLDVYSRPEHTYFAEKLVLCRLYKYRGHLADPRIDDDTENWLFVREWNGAFHQDTVKNDTIVFGLTGLQEVNTELGSVTVVGYWNNTDCEARTYVWDATCTQTPDNGYIVKNDEKDVGRWILKFDGEYLPSTYYGVYPGREANMNSLLTYVETAGTFNMKTAPGIYFVPGDYNASTVALITAKKLMIDSSTTFTRESITANDINVVGSYLTHPICDFYFTESSNNKNITVAHSSWYKSVYKFLNSGATKLVFDIHNNFTDLTLTSNVVLESKILEGNNRININYDGHYIILSKCSILGERWLDASKDYLQFRYMNITDRWFTTGTIDNFDVGTIANGNHIQADGSLLDRVELSNFDDAARWLKWVIANGSTEIDLEGRKVAKINYNQITKLSNAQFDQLYYNERLGTLEMINCYGQIYNMQIHYLTVRDSTIYFESQPVSSIGTSIACYDSNVNGSKVGGFNDTWTDSTTSMAAYNCNITVGFDYTSNNNTSAQQANLEFKKCVFNQSNNPIYVKRMDMEDCVLTNQIIKIYPYQTTGVDSATHYFFNLTFVNNVVNSTYPLAFTKYDDDNCFNVFFKMVMTGNNFINQGLECRYWQNRYGNNAAEKFIAPVLWFNDQIYANVQGHSFSYKNNIGNCPKENFKNLLTNKASFTQEYQWPSYNTNSVATQSIFPPLNQSISNSPLYHSAGVGPLNNLMEIGYMPQTWDESGTYVPGDSHYYGYFGENYYFQADYDLPLYDSDNNPVGNGSLFNIGPAVGNTTVLGYDNMKAVVYIA